MDIERDTERFLSAIHRQFRSNETTMADDGGNVVRWALIIFNILLMLFAVGQMIWTMLPLKDELNDSADDPMDNAAGSIVLPAVVFVSALVGMYGAYTRNACLLITYAGALSMMLCMAVVTFVFLLAGSSLRSSLRAEFNQSMHHYYANMTLQDRWDRMQESLECCGLDGPNDWLTIPGYTGEMPKSCGQEPLKRTGCWAKIEYYLNITRIMFLIHAVVALLVLICACYVANTAETDAVADDNDHQQVDTHSTTTA